MMKYSGVYGGGNGSINCEGVVGNLKKTWT